MPAVKHMKWWGWGVEGVGFHHEDKPGFRPFVHRGDRPRRRTTPAPARCRWTNCPSPTPMISDELLGRADRRRRARERRQRRPGPDRAHLRQERARPAAAAGRRHPAGAGRRGLPRRRGRGAAGRRPRGGGRRGAHPVRRRQQHLRQPAGARGRDPAGDLARPRPAQPGARHRRGVRAGPDPGRHARPRHRGPARPRGWTLGHFPDSFTHSTLGGWVATRSSGMQSDKYGDIADITRGLRVVHAGQGAGAPAAAQHLDRPERARDDPGLRGPARRDHRGDRAGAPDPGEAADPRLPVPVLGGRPGRDAGDLHQRRPPDGDPGVRRRARPGSPSPPGRSPAASRSPRWSARA